MLILMNVESRAVLNFVLRNLYHLKICALLSPCRCACGKLEPWNWRWKLQSRSRLAWRLCPGRTQCVQVPGEYVNSKLVINKCRCLFEGQRDLGFIKISKENNTNSWEFFNVLNNRLQIWNFSLGKSTRKKNICINLRLTH